MQTRSGQKYDLLNPDSSTIVLDDVAHALAHIGRFTGHARALYSVAQHSVLGAWKLRDEGHAAGVQAAYLMHDAHESVIGDVASPIKRALRALTPQTQDPSRRQFNMDGICSWDVFEEGHRLTFARRFGTPRDLPEAVKSMDLRMLMTEARDLMTPPPEPWGIPAEPIADLRIGRCWTPAEAKGYFLDECVRLDIR